MEQILVERIAYYYTKIHKGNDIEEKYSYYEGILNIVQRKGRIEEVEQNGGKVNPMVKDSFILLEGILEIHNIEDLNQIQRYTTTAENRMYKAMNELIKIKKLKDPNFHIVDIYF